MTDDTKELMESISRKIREKLRHIIGEELDDTAVDTFNGTVNEILKSITAKGYIIPAFEIVSCEQDPVDKNKFNITIKHNLGE